MAVSPVSVSASTSPLTRDVWETGQWDLAVSLVENFGLVPQTVFPESWNSSNSSVLDTLLTSKLREMGLRLRKLFLQLRNSSGSTGADPLVIVRREKDKMVPNSISRSRIGASKLTTSCSRQLKVIYRILTIHLGTPKKPAELVSRLSPAHEL